MSEQALSPQDLQAIASSELFDQEGKKSTFADLTRSRRVVLIFIRHFWCKVCQAFVSHVGTQIPPHNLPDGTSIIVVGCGSYQPIKTYIEATSSPYPIYANPSLSLYKQFGFKSSLGTSKAGEEKEYEKELGGSFGRVWSAIKDGPGRHIEHVNSVGPKSLNGGEVVIEADGSCSFIHRMQHTADHMEVRDLAQVIGAKFTP